MSPIFATSFSVGLSFTFWHDSKMGFLEPEKDLPFSSLSSLYFCIDLQHNSEIYSNKVFGLFILTA